MCRVDGGNHGPWASSDHFSSDQPGPNNDLLRKKPKYESCLKRTIPYVSLATDSSGRNMCVNSIISNVYIKIPDDNVCTQAILCDIASKISSSERELTLLDSKFVPVTDDDDKGEYIIISMLWRVVYLCIHIMVDIEFWRMPSCQFYVAKIDEFEEVQKTVKCKKLSLKRKSMVGHYVDLTAESDVENANQLGRIEDIIKKVCDTRLWFML